MAAFIYCALALAATPVSAAGADAVALTGPISTAELVSQVQAYLDPDWSRTVADMSGPDAGLFRPLERNAVDFGYTKSIIWLRIRLRNETADQGRWVLYFRENFKQVFEVHVVHEDGRIETPLRQDVTTGFKTRPIAYPELAAPLRIAPGETATVLVRYWSEGASYLPLQIETPTSFSAIAAKRTGKNFLYYGMILLLIVGALVALAIFRQKVFLAYVAYTTSMLVFVMHADGVAFQHLWPGFPGFNSVASMVAGSGLIIFGAIYARVFLKTAELHPYVDKMLLGVILVTLAVDAAALVYDTQQIKRFLVLLSLIALVSFTVAGAVAARRRFKEVRFFVLA
ncbi:MAG: 7TM diverse intracellular signaling domain-containing protein, partial [Alphaproteobacteria bacterium]